MMREGEPEPLREVPHVIRVAQLQSPLQSSLVGSDFQALCLVRARH
jgi:hypothetical protein